MSKSSPKLSASERKQAILAAAVPVFARLGRAGATTKDIAKAAGISEALLYRHFSGKEELYADLENHCIEAIEAGEKLLGSATPSTATLIMGVAVLVHAVFPGIGTPEAHENTKRIVTFSLLDDGQFAKSFLDRHVNPWIGLFEASLQAARNAGDIEDGVFTGKAEIWFVHHLANTLHLISLPEATIVDYGLNQNELLDHTIRFLLRGIGLKNNAIKQYYDAEMIDIYLEKQARGKDEKH